MLTKPFLRRTLWTLMVCALLLVGVIFSVGKDAVQTNRQGDAAIFEQITENIWHGKGAVSNVFSSTQNMIDRRYVFEPLSQLIQRPLTPAAGQERDMLAFHGYWIMFLVAGLMLFFSSSLALTLLQSFCFLALAVGAFYVVRKQTEKNIAALCFAALVALSPNWLGGLFGQFYPDRLFVFASFLLCCVVYFNARTVFLVAMALLVASINERAALIGGLLCVVIPFCRTSGADGNPSWKGNWKPVLIGVLMLLYSYLYKKFFLSNAYYDTFLPANLADLYQRFAGIDGFASRAVALMALNGVLLLFACAQPRLLMLALLCLLPNIVGNIGGAEKVGWLTHYHSYYFPVLVFAAAQGFSRLANRFRGKWFFPVVAGVAVIFVGWQLKRECEIGRLLPLTYLKTPFNSVADLYAKRPTGYDLRRELVEAVAAGSYVGTDELGAALLKNRARINIFPVDIDKVQYLFLPCSWIEGGDPQVKTADLSSGWLAQYGFSTARMRTFPSLGRCLLTR